MGEDSIFIELATVDPSTAKRIHPKDLTRVIRALEIFHTTGVPASEFKRCTRPSDEFEFCVTIASLPRSVLYDRINKRVDAMAASGLWDEFRSLRSSGFDERSPGMLAVGYRELFDVERNVRDFGQALNAIKADTRRYAKRQITWFTHQAHGVNEDVSVDRYDAIRTRIHDFLAAV